MSQLFEDYAVSLRQRYDIARLNPIHEFEIKRAAKVYKDNLNTYKIVESLCQVPRELIFCLHYREANLDFTRQILNGESINQVTIKVPKGLGPWASWPLSTKSAMNYTKIDQTKRWDLTMILVAAEKHNGLGYYYKNVPSPYLWSFTDQYQSGKYGSDGNYNPDLLDKQAGVVALLKGLELTNDNRFAPVTPPAQQAQPVPIKQEITEETGKILAWIKKILP